LRQGERESILDVLRVALDPGGGLRGDPESLTQFVHRCRQRGVLPAQLLDCVQRADALRQSKMGEARWTDDDVLYGLLLSLGQFELAELPEAERDAFVKRLANWYGSDPSSAIHGATGWLLRHWKQDEAVAYCRWLTKSAGMPEDDQAYGDPASLDRARFPADSDPEAGGAPRNWPVNVKKPGFRLATELEWELVCRGGTNTMYSFGNDVRQLSRYGWFSDNSDKWSHAVGQLLPSLRGLFDIHGNLFEWCHDGVDIAGEVGAEEPVSRMARGGGWGADAARCRAAYRFSFRPSYRAYDLGFRVAAVPFSQASESGSQAASDAGSGSREAE
jgi:hypothetical protein